MGYDQFEKKNQFCSCIVTNSTELTFIMSNPDDLPNFFIKIKRVSINPKKISEFFICYRPRDENKKPDLLAKITRTRKTIFL